MHATLEAVFARELRRAWRRPGDALGALLFFVVVASLFPLAVGPDTPLLAAIGPGVLWVAALLALLMSSHRLFAADLDDGVLEQMLLCAAPLTAVVAARLAAHWLVVCVPLLVVAPLVALQYGLADRALAVLVAALLLGTPTLVLQAALGAALTLGLRGASLLALVVLPLAVPVLVFGSAAVMAAQQGLAVAPPLQLLGACALLAAIAMPWIVAAALRLAVE